MMFVMRDEHLWAYYIIFPIVVLVLLFQVYQRFFLFSVLKTFMVPIHNNIEEIKANLFKEALEQIRRRDVKAKLEVLEVGVGTGENFRHFPKDSNVHILDKTDKFLPFLKGSIFFTSIPVAFQLQLTLFI